MDEGEENAGKFSSEVEDWSAKRDGTSDICPILIFQQSDRGFEDNASICMA